MNGLQSRCSMELFNIQRQCCQKDLQWALFVSPLCITAWKYIVNLILTTISADLGGIYGCFCGASLISLAEWLAIWVFTDWQIWKYVKNL